MVEGTQQDTDVLFTRAKKPAFQESEDVKDHKCVFW